MSKSSENRRGYYRIKNSPQPTAPHNRETWDMISACIKKSGGKASRGDLCHVARDHLHYGHKEGDPGAFIDYCEENGWLEKCD